MDTYLHINLALTWSETAQYCQRGEFDNDVKLSHAKHIASIESVVLAFKLGFNVLFKLEEDGKYFDKLNMFGILFLT